MNFIDSYPNTERTLTTVESMMITIKEYHILKEISEVIKMYLETKLQYEVNSSGFIRYYIEHTIRNSKYKNISPLEKEIVIANVLLPDDTKVAETLNKNGYTIEHLKTIMRFRSLLKNIILNAAPIDEELKRQFDIYKKYISQIVKLFKIEFGIDDQTIILNRICELLTRYPNYFENKNFNNSRKK